MSKPRLLAVDLFAGAGGWDEGLRPLGISPVGIEWDEAAVQTRCVVGHQTVQADVSQLEPGEFAPCSLLIASPPCQAFSAAGKGLGNRDVKVIRDATDRLMAGGCSRGELDLFRAECQDPRSLLVLEPLRWALALMPERIACEQVPPVLPLWEDFAKCLREMGYHTWTGLLSAEQYGVPQTRLRAFLMASLAGPVAPPAPTHQRYIAAPKEPQDASLFDAERERIIALGDEHLLPWISMAEALGWGMTARPVTTITAGSNRQGGADPLDGGSGTRATIRREREAGRWVQRERSGERAEEGFDPAAMPSQALTSKARSWTVHRPATTIAGDSRVFQHGGHHEPGKQSQNAIRVSIEEASVLQGFRADYPWQGSRTKQFEQAGNAVPPPLARAVVEALVECEEFEVAA